MRASGRREQCEHGRARAPAARLDERREVARERDAGRLSDLPAFDLPHPSNTDRSGARPPSCLPRPLEANLRVFLLVSVSERVRALCAASATDKW